MKLTVAMLEAIEKRKARRDYRKRGTVYITEHEREALCEAGRAALASASGDK